MTTVTSDHTPDLHDPLFEAANAGELSMAEYRRLIFAAPTATTPLYSEWTPGAD